MKLFLSLLISLLLITSVSFAGQNQPIGNSLQNNSTAAIWIGIYDQMQRTEQYGNLKDAIVVNTGDSYRAANNRNTLSFGLSYGLLPMGSSVLLVSYAPYYDKESQTITEDGINQSIAATDEENDPNVKTDNSFTTVGVGQCLDMGGMKLGVMYAISMLNSSTELKTLSNNSQKTEATVLYKTSDVFTENNTDEGEIVHLIELGTMMGDSLEPQLQVRLVSVNGDSEKDNYVLNETDTFNPVENNNVMSSMSKSEMFGNVNLVSASDLRNDYSAGSGIKYSEIQICPEIKYNPSKEMSLYLGGEIDTRSLSDDDALYKTATLSENYYIAGGNAGKVSSYTKTDTTSEYELNSFSKMEVYVKSKYKKNIADDVKLGTYPALTYTLNSYKVTATRIDITENGSDVNGNGEITEAEIQTITQEGDEDSYELSQNTISLGIPLGMEWSVSKILVFRLASSITIRYQTTEETLTDINGYTAQSTKTGTAAAVEDKLSTTQTVEVDKETTWRISNASVYFGMGLNILENLIVDLYSNSSTSSVQTYSFAAQATYLF